MNTTFYDSDCLSSFLKIDKAELLKKLFKQIHIPTQVYDELTTPDSYWLVKENTELLKEEGFIKIISLESNYQELKTYKSMIDGEYGRPIGKGEAAALSLAIANNGIIASNNLKDIKNIAKNYKIPLMTSPVILTALYEKGVISKAEVENIWRKMIAKNTKLPCENFEKYYKNLFKKDYAEFELKKYYRNLIQTE